MTPVIDSELSLLTYDQRKAAEAAFRGLPFNSQWSASAQDIYHGILAVTNGRDITESVTTAELAAI